MGTALGIILSECGFHILSVTSRRLESAQRTAELIKESTGRLPVVVDLQTLTLDQIGDVLILTTPDDVIAQTATTLTEKFSRTVNRKEKHPPRVALHTSGALPSEVLLPLSEFNFSIGSLHPLVSISGTIESASRLRGAHYGLEGEPKAVALAKEIVVALEGASSVIESRQKALYHAAVVMAAGHLTVLLSQAQEVLVHSGVKEMEARGMLLSLSSSVLENLRTAGLANSLTGPFIRGDIGTIKKHLAALRREQMSPVLETYLALGRAALSIGAQSSLPRESVTQLKELLNETRNEPTS